MVMLKRQATEGSPMSVDKRFFEDMDWAEQHHAQLLEKYQDEWVAVYNKQVVAHGSSIREVERQAQAGTGKEQIPVYFVESGSNIYSQPQGKSHRPVAPQLDMH